jgi:hypothetical protein
MGQDRAVCCIESLNFRLRKPYNRSGVEVSSAPEFETGNKEEYMDYEKKAGKNAKLLTWVDHLKSGFQPAAERSEYLANRARERAYEEEKKKRKAGGNSGPGI